jgi:hypothetical protein
MYRYLDTQDGITVVIRGRPYTVSSKHRSYMSVVTAVKASADSDSLLSLIQADADRIVSLIGQSLKSQQLTGTLTYDEGLVYYNGEALHNYAAERLCELLKLGHNITALAAFIDKQQQNPIVDVHEHLYKFLEYGKIPLTPDGDFLTYKAVRGDYKDIHSGTFDNHVGQCPRLGGGREAVDPDRNRTCSRGLHVCSYAYLPHFADAQGHVMVCKVNPIDVVAIPSDYNNTKMRVVGYEVVEEVTSYYKRGENVLSEDLLADERYEVRYIDACSDHEETYDSFYTLDEAVAQANDMMTNGGVDSCRVLDKRTNTEVHRAD